MSDSKVFSLEGKSLKLDTAEDIEPHIKALKDNEDVEEVRFLGNTLGIGASEALAKILETKKKLQVPHASPSRATAHPSANTPPRSPILPTSSQVVCSPRSRKRSLPSSPPSSRYPTSTP